MFWWDFYPFRIAKVGTQKSPMKENLIGWEFCGSLVGVLPFLGALVGVFSPLVGVWWEFGGSFYSSGDFCANISAANIAMRR